MKIKNAILLGVIGLTLILLPQHSQAQKKMIQVKGSDTMVNLVQILAEEFMAKNPKTPIAVLGGGSGTGISAIINGTCHIATHSREWKQSEINQAWEKGVKPRFFVIAIDGLSVIVNGSNTVEKLTQDQVGAIYRGEIKNWKAVGGPDMPISLYGRQSNSGTYVFLQEHVLGNKNYSSDVKEMNGNAQIIESVMQDQAGIGYVGVGYAVEKETGKVRKGLKVLNISKDAKSSAYSPLEKANIDSGNYPIARALYEAVNGKPDGGAADFIRFQVGPEGQKIVEREGFFRIGGVHEQNNEKNFK
jgi:phosphate transport system substrate-binding protein